MLPKTNRLKKKKDFEVIFKSSKSFKNRTQGVPLTLRVAKNNLGRNRFGFVVSLKVSKKAVTRNKVRRRLSEIIKTEGKNIKPNTDLIIIALPGIEKKEFSEIKEAIHKICLDL